MNDFQKLRRVILRQISSRLFSVRMAIMLPILILFIPGMAWGFSDPDVMLPGGVIPSSATEVMFYTSLGIVFGATMCAVLLSFDGVSKDRASGVLVIKLSQPMPRSHQSMALVIGHWFARDAVLDASTFTVLELDDEVFLPVLSQPLSIARLKMVAVARERRVIDDWVCTALAPAW